MTPVKTPSDAELWQFYMTLPGASPTSQPDPIEIMRAVLAKWGSPVVAGEPYAYAVYFPDQPTEELVHDLDDLCDDLTNREHTITNLYATPQPTQAQAGAVPLTPEQAQDLIELESWGPDAIGLNAQLLRTIRRTEAAHGIKGGQHD